MSVARHQHLASAKTYFAGSEAAGAPRSSTPPPLPASTTDLFYRVRPTPDGRFVVVAPDGLTIIQFYDAADMLAADAHAAKLNEPIWLALKPKGLVGYGPPTVDPGDVLVALIDKRWRFEDGPPLPPVRRGRGVFDGAVHEVWA